MSQRACGRPAKQRVRVFYFPANVRAGANLLRLNSTFNSTFRVFYFPNIRRQNPRGGGASATALCSSRRP